ncbi:MAG TPA: transketolase C-terminal domain-containing protein [Nitrospira sp.]|nr:transketolase C-terminal domain-containing protein [Nitrospira sp.]HNI20419.1 transketolase C-terminal domain-containing protein [Nitrospira sp.]HNI67056.1 transketolase C-terminal domain-containing protein [Nitrospira sp.]HNL88214.1 transketolase C-terminal domain-containing protein [Nitrospira sp.]
MRDTIIRVLTEASKVSRDIVLLTGDLGFGVLQNFSEQFPGRLINVGIAEQNMTGVAAGLSLEGKTVVTYSIGNFNTLRCLEHIRNDICYHQLHVIIVSVGCGLSYGPLGFSHHSTEDMSIMRSIPNLIVVSPGCLWEAEQATTAALNSPGSYYLRVDKASVPSTERPGEQFVLGKARLFGDGRDCTLVTTGGMLRVVLAAQASLLHENIACRVISVPTIKPFDSSVVLNSVRETKGMVTVEEHTIVGGLGSAVAEVLADHCAAPRFFRRIGLNDCFATVVGSQEYLREYYHIGESHIVQEVRRCIERSG